MLGHEDLCTIHLAHVSGYFLKINLEAQLQGKAFNSSASSTLQTYRCPLPWGGRRALEGMAYPVDEATLTWYSPHPGDGDICGRIKVLVLLFRPKQCSASG